VVRRHVSLHRRHHRRSSRRHRRLAICGDADRRRRCSSLHLDDHGRDSPPRPLARRIDRRHHRDANSDGHPGRDVHGHGRR
jgi:hypothetical protein